MSRYDHVEWEVRPAPVGTTSDTPFTLRRKSAEFRRLANEADRTDLKAELTRLAIAYAQRADEIERDASPRRAPAAATKGRSGKA
jgi:hypothetical protein